MEKYLLREKMVHCLYYHPADMQSLREVFNDAMTKKQIDGAKIDELLKRSDGEVEVTMDDVDDADIDWLETMDNPAAYGRASISTLPKWQKHDPQTYGFLNPKAKGAL